MKRLARETKSADPNTRYNAIKLLGEIGDERASNTLIDLLENPNTKIRLQTVKVLGEIKGEQAIDALIQTLSDKAPKVREQIVAILGEIGGDDAIKAITEALNDSNLRVRLRAETALKKLKATTRGKQKKKDRNSLDKWFQTY